MINISGNLISYVNSGLFVSESAWIHPKRIEMTYEIICVVDGMVCIEENDCKYELNKGDIIILKPDIEHKGYRESLGKTSFYWVHFLTENISDFNIDISVIKNFTNIALFRRLLHMANTPDYPSYGIDAILLLILGELAHLIKQNKAEESKIIREAAEWIRINNTRKLNVSEVARRYGYNSEHFSRLFRCVFSMGLKEYICGERIKVACDMLCNTSYSVKQIAAMLDFDDENQFIHFFKYHQAQSPTKFRNGTFNIHMNQK